MADGRMTASTPLTPHHFRVSYKEVRSVVMKFIKLANADWNRQFFGSIYRGFSANGTPVVRGKIKVNNGFIYAMAACQDELGAQLDELVKMVLDYGLHSDAGVTTKIFDSDFVLSKL